MRALLLQLTSPATVPSKTWGVGFHMLSPDVRQHPHLVRPMSVVVRVANAPRLSTLILSFGPSIV